MTTRCKSLVFRILGVSNKTQPDLLAQKVALLKPETSTDDQPYSRLKRNFSKASAKPQLAVANRLAGKKSCWKTNNANN